MRIFAIAAAMVLWLGIPTGAGALGVEGVTLGIGEGEQGKASAEDVEFLRHATVVSQAIVDMGELAMKRGNSPNAMTIGQRAHDQYMSIEDNLLRWARHKGMGELYRALDPEEYALMRKLKAAKDDDFDLQFLSALTETQAKLVDMFRKEKATATDPDIKQYATVELPNIEQYLKEAQGIATDMRSAAAK